MDSGVLFVSPYPQDARSLAQMLDEISVPLVYTSCLKDASRKLETVHFQVILSEADLEDGDWKDALKLARSSGAELVVTHPWADAPFWAEAINMGAYDVLAQPFQSSEVRRVLAGASTGKMAVGGLQSAVGGAG
jgi:DNA-binding NtrC family response regulator